MNYKVLFKRHIYLTIVYLIVTLVGVGLILSKKEINSFSEGEAIIINTSYKQTFASGNIFVWCPFLIYKYEFNGKTYKSSNISEIKDLEKQDVHDVVDKNRLSCYTRESLVKEALKNYSVGQAVKILYNNKSPDESILYVYDTSYWFELRIFALGLILFLSNFYIFRKNFFPTNLESIIEDIDALDDMDNDIDLSA